MRDAAWFIHHLLVFSNLSKVLIGYKLDGYKFLCYILLRKEWRSLSQASFTLQDPSMSSTIPLVL